MCVGPGHAGRYVWRGFRQSILSSMQVNHAAEIATVPSAADGHRNRPRCSQSPLAARNTYKPTFSGWNDDFERPPVGLTDNGADRLAEFGRLAGYEGVNDAERPCRAPAMRWVVGARAITKAAAAASQMGRFETEWLTRPKNLAALTDLLVRWIDKGTHAATAEERRARHGFKREPGLRHTGRWHPQRPCRLHVLPPAVRVLNELGDLERCALRSATCTAPPAGGTCWNLWSPATETR
jgi:hypothetical protein